MYLRVKGVGSMPRTVPVTANCQDCGAEITYAGSRPKLRCQKCKSAAGSRKHLLLPGAREDARTRTAAWREVSGNREKSRQATREWYVSGDNARLSNDKSIARRKKFGISGTQQARAKRYGVEYEVVSRSEIAERDKWICYCCGELINKDLVYPHPMSVTLEHVIPVSLGGGHIKENCSISHYICNSKRGNRV